MYKGRTVAVVIPSKNEEKNLLPVLKLVPGCVDEIIISVTSVDDSSWKVFETLNSLYPVKYVIQGKPGKGAAQKEAINTSSSSIVILLDADGSTNPVEITCLMDLLIDLDLDMVKGSRYLSSGGGSEDLTLFRSFGNLLLTKFANLIFHKKYTDLAYGFVGYKRESLLKLGALKTDNKFEYFNYGNGFEFETLVLGRMLRMGMKINEFPSFELRRNVGFSNLRAVRDGFRLLFTLIFERFRIINH